MAFLMIDNYDSFTYNLVQYFWELGVEMEVFRNDRIRLADIDVGMLEGIVLSPGPGTPADSGICPEIVRELAPDLPILGVCLGHQTIGEVFGGSVVRAPRLMHGKTSPVLHDGSDLFAGIPSPFEATRYHSLIVLESTLPPEIEVTARTEEGEVMALAHRRYPTRGVQFHPESILTLHGKTLLANFISLARSFNESRKGKSA
ncbi:MAG: aminodeoxychorismate/anthranilate synthase component II [Nitrospiraceae bacterium]|jgi:anthranilate synthase/aminodeoxychorismate synthase-like glutamine amidotransferase|nr:aminodeoxychorismate/anthranilate synthase component II [Nitrospiraceae bacterium]